ncbi:hypothetical protein FB451DRAFT_1297302 [Mycena latifolia]|nr:hypothetical protein FB451DRAFT_1297302 [Mycena latifolia]
MESESTKRRRTLVVFLRHFWCPLCQDYVVALASAVRAACAGPEAMSDAEGSTMPISTAPPRFLLSLLLPLSRPPPPLLPPPRQSRMLAPPLRRRLSPLPRPPLHLFPPLPPPPRLILPLPSLPQTPPPTKTARTRRHRQRRHAAPPPTRTRTGASRSRTSRVCLPGLPLRRSRLSTVWGPRLRLCTKENKLKNVYLAREKKKKEMKKYTPNSKTGPRARAGRLGVPLLCVFFVLVVERSCFCFCAGQGGRRETRRSGPRRFFF